MQLEAVIGLETHVQLKTKTKLFCPCDNDSEHAKPNTNICAICVAHPGTLPVINREALVMALRAALSLNCSIHTVSHMDRKNYFYPDLPKGYQISQFGCPVGYNGKVTFFTNGIKKEISLERLHVEEDAAKSLHNEKETLIDFNRAGTPLCEIVTKPEFTSPKDAKSYLQTLRLTMRSLGVSDADMEKGQLRCDANISLKKKNEETLYPKTEIKNLNSFRSVEKALEYEIKRQTDLWNDGKVPMIPTTRGWDEKKLRTVAQRTKEESHDYRYFPDPDLPSLNFTNEAHSHTSTCNNKDEINIQCLRATLPEMPADKTERFLDEYSFSYADAESLIQNEAMSGYAENTMSSLRAWLKMHTGLEYTEQNTKQKIGMVVGGWLTGEVVKNLREKKYTIENTLMRAEDFASLMGMLIAKHITSSIAKQLLEHMITKEISPDTLIKNLHLTVITRSNELSKIIQSVVKEHAKVVEQYQSGKETSLQFLIGMVMRKTNGTADPLTVKDGLLAEIQSRLTKRTS